MAKRGTRDVSTLMKPLSDNITWRTAPSAKVMAAVWDLYDIMADTFPNTVMPPRLTALAFEKAHEKAPCNFTATATEHWANVMSNVLRCGFAKFREIADDDEVRNTCMRKVSTDCKP